MKKISLYTKIALLGTICAAPAHAGNIPLPPKKPASIAVNQPIEKSFSVSRKGDLDMSCSALVHEAKAMTLVIKNTERIKDKKEYQSYGVTAAGAVGSFLVGTATGGIGLAVGGFLLDHNIEGGKEAADHVQDIAAQRRTFMMGIHEAKDCDGDIKAMVNAVPELPDTPSIAQIEPAAGFDVPPMNPNDRYND